MNDSLRDNSAYDSLHSQLHFLLITWSPGTHLVSGLRSLSEFQESAQLLSGPAVPSALLEACLSKVKVGACTVVNATPYDAWLERTCIDYEFPMAHVSVSLTPSTVDYVAKVLALRLMEVRFSNKYLKVFILGRQSDDVCWMVLQAFQTPSPPNDRGPKINSMFIDNFGQ